MLNFQKNYFTEDHDVLRLSEKKLLCMKSTEILRLNKKSLHMFLRGPRFELRTFQYAFIVIL